MVTFSYILGAGVSNAEKVSSMTKEIDTIIWATDANNKIMILYSPKNFGGNRSRPDKKLFAC